MACRRNGAAPQPELLEAIVVRDLLAAAGMSVVVVSVPHLDVCSALALFHDLVERRQCRGEAVHRDDPATAGERRVADLPGWVAGKHAGLAESRA